MTCDRIDLLMGLIDDELDADERREVEAHLEGCAACREQFEDFRGLGQQIAALPPEQPSQAARDTAYQAVLAAMQAVGDDGGFAQAEPGQLGQVTKLAQPTASADEARPQGQGAAPPSGLLIRILQGAAAAACLVIAVTLTALPDDTPLASAPQQRQAPADAVGDRQAGLAAEHAPAASTSAGEARAKVNAEAQAEPTAAFGGEAAGEGSALLDEADDAAFDEAADDAAFDDAEALEAAEAETSERAPAPEVEPVETRRELSAQEPKPTRSQRDVGASAAPRDQTPAAPAPMADAPMADPPTDAPMAEELAPDAAPGAAADPAPNAADPAPMFDGDSPAEAAAANALPDLALAEWRVEDARGARVIALRDDGRVAVRTLPLAERLFGQPADRAGGLAQPEADADGVPESAPAPGAEGARRSRGDAAPADGFSDLETFRGAAEVKEEARVTLVEPDPAKQRMARKAEAAPTYLPAAEFDDRLRADLRLVLDAESERPAQARGAAWRARMLALLRALGDRQVRPTDDDAVLLLRARRWIDEDPMLAAPSRLRLDEADALDEAAEGR